MGTNLPYTELGDFTINPVIQVEAGYKMSCALFQTGQIKVDNNKILIFDLNASSVGDLMILANSD